MKELLAALRGLGVKPRFHGNGFTQFQINDRERLHVWNDGVKPYENHNATIHDHVFDMRSSILLGRIVHKVWEQGSGADYMLFDRYRIDRATDKLALEAEHRPYQPCGTYAFAAGSCYTFPHRHVHETVCFGGRAASLMEKTAVHDYIEPWVLCPVGQLPVHAFDPALQPDSEMMWGAIEAALADMNESGRAKLWEAIQRRPKPTWTETAQRAG